jgi:hypothetical protein
MGVEISPHNLGTMYSIRVGDRLTHQALLLTPVEVAQLRELLNRLDDTTLSDEARNREGSQQKALTLYNGQSLPTVDRSAFEIENTLSSHFYFELVQVADSKTSQARRVIRYLT